MSTKIARNRVSNLISNSVKYSYPGGFVDIELKKVGGYLAVLFKDEGVGFASGEKDKLFRQFSQLSGRPTAGEKSVGLGLYIVKKWVEEMGGCVSAESAGVNQGATFTIKFPMAVMEDEKLSHPPSQLALSAKPQYSPSAP